MAYFIDYKSSFELEHSNGSGLRKCQLGAIWALKSHFTTSSNEIASLVSMPTGSGKTALMMAACFELKLNKVLIVVPSKILRGQICEQFKTLKVLKDNGCLKNDAPELKVYEVTKRQNSREQWTDILNEHDVIVSHPNSISPYFKDVEPVPVDLIDAILIDEAHHEPAETWRKINEFYSDLKRVFFTATPFRRDRKRMKAKLAYHYSIDRALEDGIMREVNFCKEKAGIQNTDEALIGSAIDTFHEEREKNANASILIRTDSIDDSVNLARLYNEKGLVVDYIHSKRSSKVNSQIVNKVRNNELDGLVCVGIASEGLDIPNLKVAVLHATPRSIPYTIQFLGRISRQPDGQVGNAILIANEDEVKGEVYKLYKSDETWGKLIPQLVDEQMSRARHYKSSQAKEEDFQMPELNVFFSALVYETPNDFAFENAEEISSKSPFEILRIEQQKEDSPLIIVTSHDKPLEWANREIHVEDLLDVHLLYYHSESNLLFELTTSEKALFSFKKELIKFELRRLPHSRLYKILSQFNQSDYIMVGMKNAVSQGASQPSYKTVIGSGVQASVRASEGRIFSTGHALLKIDIDRTWGLATKKGRVWAMKRGTSEEYKVWCDSLADLILNGPQAITLPGLSFLAKSEPINRIEELPIAIIPNDLFFRSFSTIIQISEGEPIRNIIPEIKPIELDEENDELLCQLKIGEFECDLNMNLQRERIWNIISDEVILVRADKSEKEVIEKSLEDILNEFYSSLIMPNGEVVEGRNKITPNRSIEILPSQIWKVKDWTGCNIRAERYDDNPPIGNIPVINKTIEFIRQNFNGGSDVLILDDGSHEIADLIWFQNQSKQVHFIHCKASHGDNPGRRKADADILFTQAMRSIHWVSSISLIDRLKERIQGNSRLLDTTQATWEALADNYKINEWNFNIILPQPGFDISQVSDRNRDNNNIYELAIPMYERILGSLASLEIWGS
ncbi:DEAD/DEAH box helicase [Ancylomarina salipaludis]|uniref:DEAD/DEAH box helicase n=1 Tax=Ancylomarina salipaludis TaxID=2501299 RepID=A0A4Q1JHL1_9BACT|nr:DEAD/DEAH box helicase family protein [Ancylomarina salipaludis]RXQ87406.1 DEAD/DEAH box helicase [Ancylomarina salipaludis]